MEFTHDYNLVRGEEETPVQLTIRAHAGCKATRVSPSEPPEMEVVHAFDCRYGCKVELTDDEIDAILDQAEEWAGEHCADLAASQADADYDRMREEG